MIVILMNIDAFPATKHGLLGGFSIVMFESRRVTLTILPSSTTRIQKRYHTLVFDLPSVNHLYPISGIFSKNEP